MLAIASFIMHYLGWQAGFRWFAPDNDYSLTSLLTEDAPICISRSHGVYRDQSKRGSAAMAPNRQTDPMSNAESENVHLGCVSSTVKKLCDLNGDSRNAKPHID